MSVNEELMQRARDLIKEVKFPGYEFGVAESHGGVTLRGSYFEADVYDPDGLPELQQTRKWVLSPHMTDSEIVSTVFKCCMTSYEHRCREHFTYMGARIFGPHFDVKDLVNLCKVLGRENAGGRK